MPRGYQVDFTGFRFADPKLPGEMAFNEVVDKLVAEAPVDEKVDFDPPGGFLDFRQSMTPTYASPDLMSVTVSTGRYDIIAEVVCVEGKDELYRFTTKTILTIGHVVRSETFIIMKSKNNWIRLPEGVEEI